MIGSLRFGEFRHSLISGVAGVADSCQLFTCRPRLGEEDPHESSLLPAEDPHQGLAFLR